MVSLGEELRRLRRGRGMTQSDLADASGLSVEGISLLERGRRMPRISTLVLLAEALGLDAVERSAWLRDAAAMGQAPTPPPIWVGRLIGRDAEVAALDRLLLHGERLVTVTGLGGVGKTRVAAAVAGAVAQRRPGGVVWIRMGVLRDQQAWWAGIAEAFGIPSGGSVESIAAQLAGRDLIVVCDGAEQVLDRCRHLILALATRAPGVRFLVTSRRRLQAPGERVFPLAPLSLVDQQMDADAIPESPAAQLFLRAAERPPQLPLTPDDVEAVRRICALVDGLPLALELVAGRAHITGLPELAADVAASLGGQPGERAAGGPELADALAESVVGWSRQTLHPEDREVLAKLSVFAGSFAQADAHAVLGGAPDDTTRGLSALVAASLLERTPDLDGQAMFRMLGVVRSVAARELGRDENATEAHRAHAEHLARLVAASDPRLTGSDADLAARALDARAEDIDAAMAWAAGHDPVLALGLAGSIWRWCYLRGRYAQGRAWAAEALDAADARPPAGTAAEEAERPLRARALGVAGGLAFLECDYDAAEPAIAAAQHLYHALGNTLAEAWALGRLGAIARERTAYDRARECHLRSLALLADVPGAPGAAIELAAVEQRNSLTLVHWLAGDLPAAAAEAERARAAAARLPEGEASVWVSLNRGILARLAGRLGEADALLARATAISERHDFPEGIAWSLNQRGVVARLRGDAKRAGQLQQAALAEHRRLGDRWRAASSAEELALMAALDGDRDRAAHLLADAARLREEIGAPVPTAEREVRERAISLLGG